MAYYDIASTLPNVLMVRYPEKHIADLGYRQQAILPFINKVRQKYGGKNFSFTIMTHRGHDTQFYPENGTLVTPTAEQYMRGYLDPTTIVTKQILTQEAISDSDDANGSLFKAIVELPKRIAKNHAFHIANHAWALDSLGKLATCGTTSAASVIVLATTANTRKFYRGMIVDVKLSSTGVVSGDLDSCTIIAVADPFATSKSITLDTTTGTTTSSHGVYMQDCASSLTPYSWNSIPTLVGTGTVHSISTSTYPEFKSYTNADTGTLTLAKIQQMVDWVEAFHEKTGESLVMYVPPEVLIKFGDLLIADVRYTQENLKRIEGGYPTDIYYRGGSMGLIPIMKDNLMPIDEIFLLAPSAFRFYATAWWEWFDKGGSKFIPESTLGYGVRFFSRGNMGIVDRSGTGKLQVINI
uniref:Putative capsid protein n=1 Tax=viral metagenome TaxID=1070528 RepID=A0A6M3XKR2_9ZZZZ